MARKNATYPAVFIKSEDFHVLMSSVVAVGAYVTESSGIITTRSHMHMSAITGQKLFVGMLFPKCTEERDCDDPAGKEVCCKSNLIVYHIQHTRLRKRTILRIYRRHKSSSDQRSD